MRKSGIVLAVMLLVLPLYAQAPPPAGDVSPVVVVTVPSASLGAEQIATILLPAGYAQSNRRYPVLYLLHGGGQDHTAFAVRSWFRALVSREMIVVTPRVGDSWYVNSAADPKAKYEDFVSKDLVEFVDGRYRTVASRDGRAVAGVSMGAWGAMLLGLKHPHLFGAVGAFSAPFGISRQDPKMDKRNTTSRKLNVAGSTRRERFYVSRYTSTQRFKIKSRNLRTGVGEMFATWSIASYARKYV